MNKTMAPMASTPPAVRRPISKPLFPFLGTRTSGFWSRSAGAAMTPPHFGHCTLHPANWSPTFSLALHSGHEKVMGMATPAGSRSLACDASPNIIPQRPKLGKASSRFGRAEGDLFIAGSHAFALTLSGSQSLQTSGESMAPTALRFNIANHQFGNLGHPGGSAGVMSPHDRQKFGAGKRGRDVTTGAI